MLNKPRSKTSMQPHRKRSTKSKAVLAYICKRCKKNMAVEYIDYNSLDILAEIMDTMFCKCCLQELKEAEENEN